jgi:hypothetical protein
MASLDPDTLLGRRPGAEALTEAGYKTSPATLATLASRGGGPRFRHYGSHVVYRWGDLLNWAQSRLGPMVTSTAQLDALRHLPPGAAAPRPEPAQRVSLPDTTANERNPPPERNCQARQNSTGHEPRPAERALR